MKLVAALRRGRDDVSEMVSVILEQPPEQTSSTEDQFSVPQGVGLATAAATTTTATFERRSIRQLAIKLAANTPLLPFDDTNFVAAEQYRMIRTRLLQHPSQPRMVLISSATPGDGKSITAINLAGVLSLKGEGSVVLIDADFRRSTIHTQLGLPVSPGMTDVLSGAASLDDALIRMTDFPNLYVVPAGNPSPNPSELLDSARWKAIREELRNRFRHVVLDSPPVASVADYELLQASSDGVLLVVRPDHTRRATCLKILEAMPREKLIGVILNCVPNWFMNRRDQYGSSYSYYGPGVSHQARRKS